MSKESRKTIQRKVAEIVRREPIRWKDVKDVQFQDDDIITSGYVEPYDDGDVAGGDHFEFVVTREREETDEEMERRLNHDRIVSKQATLRMYETYLKLKAEFEHE